MISLIDTNVLLRFFDLADPRNPEIVQAPDVMTKASEETYVCAHSPFLPLSHSYGI